MASSDDSSGQDDNPNMKVYCRLRPMNKLEISRRSKNCVDLPEDDPRCMTVDSPLEGEYDFYFDRVFEEYVTQQEVYERSIAPVPEKLLEGYNCSVIVYGQTGSGKTHTMMGVNGGVDGLLALTHSQEDEEQVDPESQGMILRTARGVFQQIQQSAPTVEFTIRCSYVEIYLEKILDLLNPGSNEKLRIVEDRGGDEAAGVGNGGSVQIAGAAELCCVDEADVYKLLARGNACRTMSSTEMNTDSSRSHAIFIMKVEQHDKSAGTVISSELVMVDLAGSEMANQNAAPTQRDASAVQMEAKMINKSLTALQNCIRAQLENQRGGEKHSVVAMSKQSKLTRFLRPCFGGNCMTWLILTASPSTYNIGETMSTIKFGQRVTRIQNSATITTDFCRKVYRERLKESEKQRKVQTGILKAVAQECKNLREQAAAGSFDEDGQGESLWDTIDELLASGDDVDAVDFKSFVQNRAKGTDNGSGEAGDQLENARRQIEELREQLESISKAKEESDNELADLQSEVAVLRSQNEHLIADKTKDIEEVINAKNEFQIMSQRKIEVEHNFRTSQFRENEAIVFLRQFRRFYRNVLRDRAAQGSGSIQAITTEISEKVPGALDLSELVDADKLLLEAGLIEEHEMRDEKVAQVYVPSKTALIRSATAAKKAAAEMGNLESAGRRASFKRVDSTQSAPDRIVPSRSSFRRRGSAIRRSSFASLDKSLDETIAEEESAKMEDVPETVDESAEEAKPKSSGAGADAGAGAESSQETKEAASEAVQWDQTGRVVTKRQQLLGTPSGRFAIMNEKKLESELEDLADKCIKLEQALKEEKATVDMLSGRAGGVNKKKLAQEAIQLRQQIEKKTQNLMAIAWKMNELNLINKSYNEKMVNREQHVVYLEENYVELQNRNRMIIEQQQEAERKLRDELDSVRKVLGGMSVQLWQYNERKLDGERPFTSRILLPIYGGNGLAEADGKSLERRMSDAESEPSIDFHEKGIPQIEKVEASTQTDEVEAEDAQVQTKEVSIDTCEIGVQTDEVMHEDIGIMTDEAFVVAVLPNPSSDSVDVSVQTSLQEEDEEEQEAAGTVVGAVGTTARAVAIQRSTDHSESKSDVEAEDTVRGLAASGAAVATADERSTESVDHHSSESSRSDEEIDKSRELSAIVERSQESETNESDQSVSDGETDFASKMVASGAFNIAVDSSAAPSDSDESDVEAGEGENEKSAVGNSVDDLNDNSRNEGSRSDASQSDDIEALAGGIAAEGVLVVPRSVSVGSNHADDDEESIERDGADPPVTAAGKAAMARISGAAVVAAAASLTRETEAEKGKYFEANGKTENFMAKNIFAATVMSVLNLGADKSKEAEATPEVENEIESYQGDGHSPNIPGHQEVHLAASSRDEWAAARDDFDSIFEETAQAVNTASSRRRPIMEDDPEKSSKEFMDIAARIGHKSEEEIVTMGSKRQLWSHKDRAIEEARKPWENDEIADKRKPWEKTSKRGKDDGSLGSSFDVTKEDWYSGSDEESDDSYRFETHVLKRSEKKEPLQEGRVKFSDSTAKRDASQSEDEFDQMMNATQVALGVAEELSKDDVDNHPETDATSLIGKKEAMFRGGRTNGFKPRRSADRPKIRAGVLKQENKSTRDKSSSQSLRKKLESRRKLGDDKSRRKKKKKSSRDLSHSKSERYPSSGRRDKDQTRSPRRRSEGKEYNEV